jgi:hypothetical protein
MAEKCEICRNKIEETFLGKLNGTIIGVKKNTRTGKAYVCSACQKEHKEKINGMVNK